MVKFDQHSNSAEGADSIALYLNGAVPTTPAMEMTSSADSYSVARQVQSLFLQVVRLKFFDTAHLYDHRAFLRCEKMRDASRNNDETACRVAL